MKVYSWNPGWNPGFKGSDYHTFREVTACDLLRAYATRNRNL